MHWKRLTICIALLCLGATQAPAATVTAEPSLEWAVESSQRVVRGVIRPGSAKEIVIKDAKRLEMMVDVSESIKGDAKGAIVVFAPINAGMLDAAKSWGDVLLFLQPADAVAGANSASDKLGAWVTYREWALVLGDPMRPVARMDGSLLAGGDAVVKAARDAASFAAKRGGICPSAVLPLGQRAGEVSAHLGLPVTHLIVPQDSRLETIAQEWVAQADWTYRGPGLEMLAAFKSPGNIARVRRILADDPIFHVDLNEEWSPRLDERAWKEFPVREAALAVLVAWKESGQADGEIHVPLLLYSPVKLWRWAGGAGLILIFGAVGWRRAGLGGMSVALCIGAMIAVIALAWASAFSARTYSFAGAGADWEIVSAGGQLAILRVQDDAPPHEWMTRKYEPAAPEQRLWFAGQLNADERAKWLGFGWMQGITNGAGYSFRLVELPWWALAVGLVVWPVIWAKREWGRARRRRMRDRAGLARGLVMVLVIEATVGVRAEENYAPPTRHGSAFTSPSSGLPTVNSIEATASQAPIIVRGTMVATKRLEPWGLAITEIIKGNVIEPIVLATSDWQAKEVREGFLNLDCIYFLRITGEGRYQLFGHEVEVGIPTRSATSVTLPWRLEGRWERTALSGRQVSDTDELLKLVRAQATRRRTEQMKYVQLDMATVGLIVPVDEGLEAQARLWLGDGDPKLRLLGVRSLSHFKSAENAALLKRMLSDDSYELWDQNEYWESLPHRRVARAYLVRDAAGFILSSWEMPGAATIYAPHQSYVAPPSAIWYAMVGAGSVAIFLSWRKRVKWRNMVKGVLVFLTCMMAWLAWRSTAWGCDLASFALTRTNYELASTNGRIFILRVDDRAPARELMVKRGVATGGQPWFAGMLLINQGDELSKWGFRTAHGTLASIWWTPPKFRLIEFPISWPIGILILWPGLGWIRAGRHALRRRRWRRSGRCVACGYDLRGSGSVCPECGLEIVR